MTKKISFHPFAFWHSILSTSKFKFAFLIFIISTMNSCGESLSELEINFRLVNGKNIVTCQSPVKINDKAFVLEQFQIYLSNFYVRNQIKTPITEKNITNKVQEVKLLGGVCSYSGNWKVTLTTDYSPNEIQGIQFDVGVPFELNHQDPMTQPAPLNQPDMFWVWQTGHKFMRLELRSDQTNFTYHLGSTGCQSQSAIRPPKVACKNPNRPTIVLDEYKAGDTILIDIGSLLSESKLEQDINCKSSPSNADCTSLLKRSGIGGAQKLFRIKD